jgi:uncharacterized repeat protein (TIGR02059 family)
LVRNHNRIAMILSLFLVIQLCAFGIQPGRGMVEAASAGPILLSTVPADNASTVQGNANLMLTFDENVTKGTGSAAVTIYRASNNAVVESFVVSSSNRVTINPSAKNLVTVDPTADLSAGEYYILVDTGAFRNEGNSANYAGLASATAWSFTVAASADVAAPVVTAVDTNVDSGQALTVTFNEPVYASIGSITITNTGDPSDIQAIGIVSPLVTGSGTPTLTIAPQVMLRPNSTYAVAVDNQAIQDSAGNRTTALNWTVSVNAAPMTPPAVAPTGSGVSSTTPIALTMTFSENVLAGPSTKTITVKRISDNSNLQAPISVTNGSVAISNNVVTISLSTTMAPNTGYYVLIEPGAFTNAAGTVNYQGIVDASTWNFSTAPTSDSVRPTITELKPLDNGNVTALSTTLEATFSEPVFPSNGQIVIKNALNDMIFETIPVTSSYVTGGGTNKITITPASSFINNASYYIQIGSQAFRDGAGNYYLGITDKTTWNFSVSQDTVVPTLTALSPANNTQSVPLNATFTATFSEAVRIGTGNIVIKRIGGTAATIATTASIDPADNKKLVITPTAGPPVLQSAASYYVEIPAGAVEDLAGNDFGGILNEYTWTFKTIGSDLSTPVLSTAAMSGSTKIVLTYNEELDTTSIPAPGNFYVTVNDSPRSVTAVEVAGTKVNVTLASGVVFGQTVKLYYSQGTNPIRDLSQNKAANLSSQTVTNTPDSTLPTPLSGTINGALVTIQFNEELQTLHASAYSQFSVYAAGSNYTVTNAFSSGNAIILTLNTPITNAATTYVNYSPGSYPLRDLSNNAVSAFSGFYVRNTLDAIAPTLLSASAAGSTITLSFNEGLDTNSKPNTNQFIVLSGGSSRSVSSVSISGAQVVLTLGSAVSSGQSVTISYLGGTPAVKDLNGNAASAFSNVAANNGSVAVTLASAAVSGSDITLTYSQALRTTSIPAASQFIVKVNGAIRTVSNVSVSGSTVRLQLLQAVTAGNTVTVNYAANTSNALQTITGEAIGSLSDYPVSNQSTWVDSLGNDYESLTGGGVNIKISAATSSYTTSPGGSYANRYTLTTDKLTVAFNGVRNAGGNTVTFTVPANELAAMVAIPLQALDLAAKQQSTAKFALKHKDVTYELPLSALNFTSLYLQAATGGGSAQLLIEIDSGSNASTAMLRTAISLGKLQSVADPVHFRVSLMNGSTRTEVTDFSQYVTRYITTSEILNERQTSVVWFDTETSMLSYVPTQFSRTGNVTTAAFKRKGNSAYALVKANVSYSDLSSNHWARADVLLMANKFIAEGRTAGKFDPDKPITRGEFATFIARGLGLAGDKQAAAKFKDVNTATNMAAYIGAAAKANIVAGITTDTFQPNSPITREQMASMMVRASKAAGVELKLSQSQSTILQRFKDRGKISNWAQADVAMAVNANIIAGMPNNEFSPKTNASRAQAVVMIKRLLSTVNFIDE